MMEGIYKSGECPLCQTEGRELDQASISRIVEKLVKLEGREFVLRKLGNISRAYLRCLLTGNREWTGEQVKQVLRMMREQSGKVVGEYQE